jgi:uncharacterized protein YyaL (SSP411 family)
MPDHKHTNSLINETSPYLLQHAHNPVDWHAWDDKAFAKARSENKPILLSIGYSACHWCHVMEHESFEDEEIARLMNDNFVSIKVDREERPDLDQIYMNAVQMMTGHGGWPMTMFLTPDGVPFYGGTYFPPEDRYNMPGFPRVLLSVAEAYRAQPDQVAHTATSMLGELRRLGLAQSTTEMLTTDLLDTAHRGIAANYDRVNGGFGGAPKFPPSMTLEFLLHTHYRTRQPHVLEIVQHTCRKMAGGGMYDQLGGGFHRYSVDAKWLVPHFEKMLYDNAQLSRLYLHLYQATKDDLGSRIATETLEYVLREMTDRLGGFYSSQDADSEGHEGKFFVWSQSEIIDTLGEADGALFCDYFNVTEGGNFEGHNILNIADTVEAVAQRHAVSADTMLATISGGRRKLFEMREGRVKPDRDEKVLTAWNGLMLASLAEGAAVLERDDFRRAARKNARFLLDNLRRNGLLLRTYKDGQAKLNGYLEDYAFFIDGLVSLYEVTGELTWLENAITLTDKMIEEFWDESEGGFFFTGKSHEQLIVRSKDFFDNATPSGNSVAVDVLLRLSILTGKDSYRHLALTTLRLLLAPISRYPSAFGRALCALDLYLSSPKEIVIVGDPENPATRDLARVVWQSYLPNRVIARSSLMSQDLPALIPLLQGRQTVSRPTAYVCQNYTCESPVTDPLDLEAQLKTP